MQVVGPEYPGEPILRVLPYSWPEVEEDPQGERARHAVHDRGRDRVMEAEPERHPAAGAPAPGGVEDPDDRAQDRGEHQVGRQAHSLQQRSGHDRGRRPGEQEEGQEEDQVDVVGQVRAERVAPGDAARAGRGGEVGRVRADRQTGLVAVVDPPAEVVEGRRDRGDREDVLHRRRHHVLAASDAGLVGHEAGVDQPHQDDGPEVELLPQDGAVERLGLGACRVLQVRHLCNEDVDHDPLQLALTLTTSATLSALCRMVQWDFAHVSWRSSGGSGT